MKIPSMVKIGGHLFEILFKSESKDQYERSGTKRGWDAKIFLQGDMVQSKQESILLHEVLEEINYQNELELKHHQIATMAEGFYQFLKDNKLVK